MEKDTARKTRALGLIISLAAILLFSAAYLLSNRSESGPGLEARLGSCRFQLEIADSAREQYRGLSGRKSLCPDCGLLFVFGDSQPRNFVMRNMHFPLDIIYLEEGQVSEILVGVEPETEPLTPHISREAVDMALEINAGEAERCEISASSSIYFSLENYDY